MGRLEDIAERNKHPGRHRKNRFPLGLAVSMFVLLILVLVIFTDFEETGSTPVAPTATVPRDPTEKHVNGVLLYRDKPRAARDAGIAD